MGEPGRSTESIGIRDDDSEVNAAGERKDVETITSTTGAFDGMGKTLAGKSTKAGDAKALR